MLAKANIAFYEPKEATKSNKEKGVWSVAQKVGPHP